MTYFMIIIAFLLHHHHHNHHNHHHRHNHNNNNNNNNHNHHNHHHNHHHHHHHHHLAYRGLVLVTPSGSIKNRELFWGVVLGFVCHTLHVPLTYDFVVYEILIIINLKVLQPATSTQVFLGFPLSISKCWDGSQHSKLPLHASHVALRT